MNYELSREQIDFKKRFREFCDQEIAPHAAEIEATASSLRENCRGWRGRLFQIPLPRKIRRPFSILPDFDFGLEELARSCPSTFLSCVLGSMLTAISIHRYGKNEQKERQLLP